MSCNLFGGRAIQRKLRLLHPLIGPENICASDSDLDSDLEVINAKVIIWSSILPSITKGIYGALNDSTHELPTGISMGRIEK